MASLSFAGLVARGEQEEHGGDDVEPEPGVERVAHRLGAEVRLEHETIRDTGISGCEWAICNLHLDGLRILQIVGLIGPDAVDQIGRASASLQTIHDGKHHQRELGAVPCSPTLITDEEVDQRTPTPVAGDNTGIGARRVWW